MSRHVPVRWLSPGRGTLPAAVLFGVWLVTGACQAAGETAMAPAATAVLSPDRPMAATAETERRELVPEPAAQTAIRAVVGGFIASTNDAGRARIQEGLERVTRGIVGRVALLEQFVIFLEGSRSTEASMGAAVLINNLKFTLDEKMAVVLAHLAGAPPTRQKILHDLLSTVGRPDGEEPDFTTYGPYLSMAVQEVENASAHEFIRYLYGVDRMQALEAFLSLEDAPRRRRARVLEAARQGREDFLAADSQWWVRLAAAGTPAQPTAAQP